LVELGREYEDLRSGIRDRQQFSPVGGNDSVSGAALCLDTVLEASIVTPSLSACRLLLSHDHAIDFQSNDEAIAVAPEK
jgi:hypothetical protein